MLHGASSTAPWHTCHQWTIPLLEIFLPVQPGATLLTLAKQVCILGVSTLHAVHQLQLTSVTPQLDTLCNWIMPLLAEQVLQHKTSQLPLNILKVFKLPMHLELSFNTNIVFPMIILLKWIIPGFWVLTPLPQDKQLDNNGSSNQTHFMHQFKQSMVKELQFGLIISVAFALLSIIQPQLWWYQQLA